MREIKFSYMWHNGLKWLDLRYTLKQIQNGEPYEYFENEPLLKSFVHKYTRQYTGMKDKDDNEIYEGDILSGIIINGEHFDPASVIFDAGAFSLGTIPNYQPCLCETWAEHIKIIGNIHENPELLEMSKED